MKKTETSEFISSVTMIFLILIYTKYCYSFSKILISALVLYHFLGFYRVFFLSHTHSIILGSKLLSCHTQLLYLHMRDGEGGRTLYAKSTQKVKNGFKSKPGICCHQDFTILSVTSQ